MLGPANVFLRGLQAGGNATLFPLLLTAQQRKVQCCQNDLPNRVPPTLCALHISCGKRVRQVQAGRIWVSLNDQNSFGHEGHLRVDG